MVSQWSGHWRTSSFNSYSSPLARYTSRIVNYSQCPKVYYDVCVCVTSVPLLLLFPLLTMSFSGSDISDLAVVTLPFENFPLSLQVDMIPCVVFPLFSPGTSIKETDHHTELCDYVSYFLLLHQAHCVRGHSLYISTFFASSLRMTRNAHTLHE